MHYFRVARNLLEQAEAKRLNGNHKEICSIGTDFSRALRPYPDAKRCTRVLKGRINGRLAKEIHHEGWEQLVAMELTALKMAGNID